MEGHPTLIRPGKPIFYTAFQEIARGPPSSVASFDYQLYKTLVDVESTKIKSYEQELREIAAILEHIDEGPIYEMAASANMQHHAVGSGTATTKATSSWWPWASSDTARRERRMSKDEAAVALRTRHAFLCDLLRESQLKVAQWHAMSKHAQKSLK